jgi:hypothetical protein
MLSQHTSKMEATTFSSNIESFHNLSCKWTLWAHLPHNTDWSIKSYIPISTFSTIEETTAIMETLPSIMVENCMLFMMRQGIEPRYEDIKNRKGGYFSNKVLNKNVYKVWKELSYVTVGESVINNTNIMNCVTGITISPKKNFCIIKIWMTNRDNQNPAIITDQIKELLPRGWLFGVHDDKL